jgi:pimeloyl-ACP methyl ester carboxylesterase
MAARPHPRRPIVRLALALALAGLALGACGSGSHTPVVDDAAVSLPATITERPTEVVGAGGLRLGAVLTLPAAVAGQTAVPAVLIVPGLGALDHNAVAAAGTPDAENDTLSSSLNRNSPGSVDPLYQDLAQALARAGLASLRYDKRGTAASRLPAERALSFDDEVADAKAALAFLGARREIGASPLAVLGHDEGGVVALRAAAGNPQVKAAVLVSTPGRPLVDVLAGDTTRLRGAALGDQERAAVASLLASGKVPAATSLPALLRPIFPPGADAYLVSLFSLDPVAEAKAAVVPTLLVRGGADRTVAADDTDLLAAAFAGRVEVLVAGVDANHNLAGPDGRDTGTADTLSTWVKARLTA